MRDPNTGLTLAALTGERKQSVVDAERMLSYLAIVGKFLSENGYEKEGDMSILLLDCMKLLTV